MVGPQTFPEGKCRAAASYARLVFNMSLQSFLTNTNGVCMAVTEYGEHGIGIVYPAEPTKVYEDQLQQKIISHTIK